MMPCLHNRNTKISNSKKQEVKYSNANPYKVHKSFRE
jgi:hypothetical protein